MMVLHSLWIVITLQEKSWIENKKQLAEIDRNNSSSNDEMPNEIIQGTALTADLCPPSLAVRSLFSVNFWIFYWNLEYQRIKLSRNLPAYLTSQGAKVPNTAQIIPVLTKKFYLFDNDKINMEIINLRSLIKDKHFIKLSEYYNELNYPIDFMIIYIEEAHASDRWKFDRPKYSFIKNHKNIQDRLNAVKILIEITNITKENHLSIYSDTMDNHTNHLFRAWPERLYVLHNDQILYQGQPGPSGYSIPTLDYFLKRNVNKQ
ncbi:unnamed protein product [Rotaria magnacalcarata]|uniref:Iodothyronine deiodinase n=2 Tax=Rotaria magnacalcarata TaxID=392030 RepID=A0A819FKB6_9BILA|nr:unnamed protein product [Rotaria magnacalcarata]CAF3814147.1 unnamed protein product [Rotaria magnacalcarata]CAF3870427.1 unnamed protein product [Rotaria magnacalcarata]CAF3906731.1 unnamed protein product [Rotaria magnacalcarata]CAF3926124.1 unnamed protein product [Rotaria magnacalcarata]